MHHASYTMQDVIKYDVMKYDIMKYDVIKYDVMKQDAWNMTSWIQPVIGPNLECYIVEEVIKVDEVNESKNICCTRKTIQIMKGLAEVCHTQNLT